MVTLQLTDDECQVWQMLFMTAGKHPSSGFDLMAAAVQAAHKLEGARTSDAQPCENESE